MKFFSRKDIANLLQVSPATVCVYVRSGKLSKPKIEGRRWLFSELQVKALCVLLGKDFGGQA